MRKLRSLKCGKNQAWQVRNLGGKFFRLTLPLRMSLRVERMPELSLLNQVGLKAGALP